MWRRVALTSDWESSPDWASDCRRLESTKIGSKKRDAAYLQDLAVVGGTVDVLAGLVHAQSDTVEQDHHDADPLEPRADAPQVKEQRGSYRMDGWMDGWGGQARWREWLLRYKLSEPPLC